MTSVRTAVIPAAGLGTRFLPASKAIPKEMVPVVDKPTIQYIVEECVAAGIEDVLIIDSSGKSSIGDHFDRLMGLEAALEGTPAAAHGAGGYLETVRPGVNGFLAASETPADLAVAMRRARGIDAESCREWARGFSRDVHVARIARVIEEVVQRA